MDTRKQENLSTINREDKHRGYNNEKGSHTKGGDPFEFCKQIVLVN